ncbi:MerR family transcriptional regulator [Taibaiella koreensis]|uniref:MerR family transcriptional regulator n=1 Tax=Taibaiella koreensis TaxID=1268548 RepID=UPI000E59CE76|nr:MerR family transcriptional regulator [Taibaiella koreensis]
MKTYSVARLAALAGVSVRTLHLYDQIDLLKPAARSGAGYRSYGEPELLRLQQILFYKELGLSLQEIAAVLDNPDFDLILALEGHKAALQQKQRQLDTLLITVEKTITNLKEKRQMKHEELYEGLGREEAQAYRRQAITQYGQHAVERSEQALLQRAPEALASLKAEQLAIAARLRSLQDTDPESGTVQEAIALHYRNIRRFWGTDGDPDTQAEAYKGLADLYLNDDRFLQTDGRPQPAFAAFMKQAMHYFVRQQL